MDGTNGHRAFMAAMTDRSGRETSLRVTLTGLDEDAHVRLTCAGGTI